MLNKIVLSRKLLVFVIPFLMICLYLFTVPQNHSEAEDAFRFASEVEKKNLLGLFHSHHLLYLPIVRAFYSLGVFERSFPLMIFLNKLLGIITAFLFWLLLRKRLGVDSQLATLGAMLLAVSYGFWRYSNEAEVYILACFTTIILCWLLFIRDVSYKLSMIGGILAAVALMGHMVNFLLVCIALPIRFLLRKQVRSLCIYTLVTSSIMLSTYYFLQRAGSKVKNSEENFLESKIKDKNEAISAMSIQKGIIGFGQNVVSGNFLFSYAAFTSFMSRLVPNAMLEEEKFMGQKSRIVSRILAPASFLGLIGLVSCIIYLRIQSPPSKRIFQNENILAIMIWSVSYAVFIMWFAPEQPEAWIIGLVPFWSLVVPCVLEPVYHKRPQLIIALVGLLFLHNYVGGMLLINDKESDWNYKKAEWLVRHTSENDIILTLEKQTFSNYLNYHTKSTVVNLHQLKADELQRVYSGLNNPTRRVYATNDIFAPPGWYAHRDQKNYRVAREFANRIVGDFQKVVDNEFGGIYLKIH